MRTEVQDKGGVNVIGLKYLKKLIRQYMLDNHIVQLVAFCDPQGELILYRGQFVAKTDEGDYQLSATKI